jgi:uncharacterized protein (TIGR02147 family)
MKERVTEFLVRELSSRTKRNTNYSMRAFARDLNLAPSHLSNLLKGQAGLSRKSATKIASNLLWSARKSKIFIEMVEGQFARSKMLREKAEQEIKKINIEELPHENIELDQFKFISEWYHLAILELFEIKQFVLNDLYIASKLGISEKSVKEAISLLIRLKFLKKSNGRLNPSNDKTLAGDTVPSKAIREFHEQLIKKSLESINTQDISERILRGSILAIKKDRLNDALIMLQDFHDEFCEQIGEGPGHDKDEVYCLSSQFFRLTTRQGSL